MLLCICWWAEVETDPLAAIEGASFSSSFFRVSRMIKLPELIVDMSSICRY